MENLRIAATASSPEIRFDREKRVLAIRGESFPENTEEFYAPVLSFLRDHLRTERGEGMTVNMELIYFNTSSAKVFMNMFDMLEGASGDDRPVRVNWIYDEENENAQMAGEEFREIITSPLVFNLVRKDT